MRTFPRGTIDPWYLTGFVEGEGTFTFSKSGNSLGLYFGIRMTRPDEDVVPMIQELLGGIGQIYSKRNEEQDSCSTYYRVNRIDELKKVVAHFETYPLQGYKAKSFEIWKEMVRLKSDRFREPISEDLESLADQLRAVSIRNQAKNQMETEHD